MPRFYFHICDGSGFVEDEEGRELPSAERAHKEAIKGARDLISAEAQKGAVNLASYIEVENDARELLFMVTFSDAFEIKSQPCPRPPRNKNGARLD